MNNYCISITYKDNTTEDVDCYAYQLKNNILQIQERNGDTTTYNLDNIISYTVHEYGRY